jgi:cyclopropane fatty-acyl-phospholipid synthase-like methyltransferase
MTKDFYNQLAPYYKYIYSDWDKSVTKQAADLDSIIKEFFGNKKTVLDASCGIGTQSIGLAELGYEVSASDLSDEEVKLAKVEADKRNLDINFQVADMREVSKTYYGKFDIVMSADNSIPHLLTDEDILKTFKEFYQLLNPEGACIITVRDYENINPEKQKYILNPRQFHNAPKEKVVMFDLWEFDGDYYDLNTYLVKDNGNELLETIAMRSRYYCIAVNKLEKLMQDAGFINVKVLKDRFYQPVILGTKT